MISIRAQSTESILFAIDNFRRFLSNSTKLSVVIETTALCANYSQQGAIDSCWSQKHCSFYRKVYHSLMVIIVSRVYHISYKRVINAH